MGIEVDLVRMARQWRAVIERAAITEGIDRVDLTVELEEKRKNRQTMPDAEVKEIDMKLESEEKNPEIRTESRNIEVSMEIELKEDTKTNKTNKDMEDIRFTNNIIEIDPSRKKNKEKIYSINKLDIVGHIDNSLNKSMWAPRKESCVNKKDILSRVAAINVDGENYEHREKSLRWLLRENKHIKKITEKFTNGNLWCMITFDCEKGYEEAKEKLENPKEEYERLRLFSENNNGEGSKRLSTKTQAVPTSQKNNIVKREKQAEKELKEIFKQRKEKSPQSIIVEEKVNEIGRAKIQEEKEEVESTGYRITIWDLPTWAKRTQVFEAVRFLGRVEHIEMIREGSNKAKAEVVFVLGTVNKKELEETWSIPFTREYLVRMTPGINNFKELKSRNKHTRRLIDLPENTNEVLLWRQIRRTGAKALHIFKNSNSNNMRSATVYFASEEDLQNSTRWATYYYNNKLKWGPERNNDAYTKENFQRQQGKEENKMNLKNRACQEMGKLRFEEEEPQGSWDKEKYRREENHEEEANEKQHKESRENYESKENNMQLDTYNMVRKLEKKIEALEMKSSNYYHTRRKTSYCS
jgi:hypothetical protein